MPNPLLLTDAQFANWLDDSGKSIGGSDIGSLVGANSFAGPASVWDTIMEQVPRSVDNTHIQRGRHLESFAADMYGQQTNRQLLTCPTFYSETHPFFRYSPDRIIVPARDASGAVHAANESRTGRGVLEIKVPALHNWQEARLHGVDPSYYAQLQWYMGGARKRWGAFAIFNADRWELFHFDVEFDEAYFLQLEAAALTFWNDHVLTRQRPVDASMNVVGTPRVGGEARTVEGLEWAGLINQLRAAQERKRLAEHEYEMAAESVQAMITQMGPDVDVVTGYGATIRWNQITQNRFDLDRFRREQPELAQQYVRQVSTRPFRVNFGRET